MATCTVSAHPFEKIALSCSGGGYRAATFHLGAMAYLNRLLYNDVPLLDHVKMISTVSGGTITGIVYALMREEGKSFGEIYDFMLNQLKQVDLIKEGLVKLNPGAQWDTPTKHKNLINAFSELYNGNFTKGKTLADLKDSSILECVVFNSTEFNNAIDFRFFNTDAGYTGNNYFKNYKEIAGEIKLADIMAASSCFPGGFEPIIWPHDFVHANSPNIEKLKLDLPDGVGLMDGGIYDNQGIGAILNYKNGRITPYFDLIIVSDVASPYMTAYKPVPEEEKKGWYSLTLGDIKTAVRKYSKYIDRTLVIATVIAGLLPLLWHYTNSIWSGLSIGLGISFAALFIAKKVAEKKIAGLGQSLKKLVAKVLPQFYLDRLALLDVDKLSLHRIEPLILDRVNSLKSLLFDVFLKVVRRLNYSDLYNNTVYEQRRISNLVQELTQKDFDNKQPDKIKKASAQRKQVSLLLGTYQDNIGPAIQTVAEEAAKFGTTLWFTEQEQLDDLLNKLVITGKVTMCYNILEYLENILFDPASGFTALDAATQAQLTQTYDQCKEHWLAFKKNPFTGI